MVSPEGRQKKQREIFLLLLFYDLTSGVNFKLFNPVEGDTFRFGESLQNHLTILITPCPFSPWKTEEKNRDLPALTSAAKQLKIKIKKELDLAERMRKL